MLKSQKFRARDGLSGKEEEGAVAEVPIGAVAALVCGEIFSDL